MDKSNKKVYFQTFKESYSVDFPCILKSRKGDKFAFCTVCGCDINIAHGGRNDVSNHVKCRKHLGYVKSKEDNKKINSFFAKSGNVDSDVIRAECLFTSFLVEHNVPLSAADHAGALFKKMFPTSEVAKKYGCGRTKTTCIVNKMAKNAKTEVVECLQNGPFSLATDGSNDTNAKLYPIVVTFYDNSRKKIVSSVLSIPALNGDSTGRNIGNLLLSELNTYNIPIENCVAFCSDNAPVMIGHKNGVSAVLKEVQPDIAIVGCICHLINLAAEKGAGRLPLKVDEMLVDIFYFLEKSCKRKERLQKFQNLHNKEAKTILKHVCTRWLSVGRCLNRLLDQWDPLLSFFKEEVLLCSQNISTSLTSFRIPRVEQSGSKENQKKRILDSDTSLAPKRIAYSSKCDKPILKNQTSATTREEKLFMFLSSNLNKAFCTFLHVTIPVFDKLNVALQTSSPQVHILLELLMDLLKQLFSKFVKPKIVKSSSLLEVPYNLIQNQRTDEELVIGIQTSNLVNDLQDTDKSLFFSSVRNYFCTACDYIINRFPLRDDVLNHAQVARLDKIEDAQFSSIRFFLEKFPIMLCKEENETTDEAVNELQRQFTALQVDDTLDVNKDAASDSSWAQISTIRGADGLLKYNRISRVMLCILTIPHSNAECERVFSLVKKNRTQFRSCMSNESLESLSILKTRSSGPCYDKTFSQDFLQEAKKATTMSLKSK